MLPLYSVLIVRCTPKGQGHCCLYRRQRVDAQETEFLGLDFPQLAADSAPVDVFPEQLFCVTMEPLV